MFIEICVDPQHTTLINALSDTIHPRIRALSLRAAARMDKRECGASRRANNRVQHAENLLQNYVLASLATPIGHLTKL